MPFRCVICWRLTPPSKGCADALELAVTAVRPPANDVDDFMAAALELQRPGSSERCSGGRAA